MLRLFSRFRDHSYTFIVDMSRTLCRAIGTMADSISVVKPEQASEDTAPLQLLGYNLPLNLPSDRLKWNQFSKHRRDPFPNALHWGATPITLRERAMIAFMCQITEKPDWERKVRDEDITKKWQTERAELEKQIEANGDDHGFSEAMFEYVSSGYHLRSRIC